MAQLPHCGVISSLVKHIPWAAFKMVEADWKRVIDARDILGVSPVHFHSSRRVNKQIP
jgi:hypothetical protein